MKTTYGSAVPIYCSTSFDWKGNVGWADESKLIKLDTYHSSLNYKGVGIKSIKTGEVKYFEPIYDEDGYDGEYMMFGCDNISVQIWNY